MMNKETTAEKTEIEKATPEGYAKINHSFVDRFAGDKEVSFSFLFKKPSKDAVDRTQSMIAKKPGAAYRNLCVSCVHADDKEKMLAAFDEYPGLPTSFGNALLSAAGFGDLGN